MRPTEDQVVRKVIRSDLPTTTFSLRVDETTFRQQIDGLYSDKPAAVTREIIANAIDAHAMTQNTTDAVEVTLPSTWSTNFIVRDYGPGMPHDFVMENYTCLGVSTKTRTNVATGMFGYGSKTPFAVSDAFTIAVFDNGTQRTYSAFFNEDGIPSLSAHPAVPTTERNGTRVSVNVKAEHASAFSSAIIKQWGIFFDKKINWNNTLASAKGDERSIVEHVKGLFALARKDSGYSFYGKNVARLFVRQGSAMYPAHDLCSALNNEHRRVAGTLTDTWMIDVPIGTASPTPSREAIQWNEATRQAVIKIAGEALEQLFEKLSAQAKTCKSVADYAALLAAELEAQEENKTANGNAYTVMAETISLFNKVVTKNFEDSIAQRTDVVTEDKAAEIGIEADSKWRVGSRIVLSDGTVRTGVDTSWTFRLSAKMLLESGNLATDRVAIYEVRPKSGVLGKIETLPVHARLSAPRGRNSGDSREIRPFDYVFVIPTGTMHWTYRFQKLIAELKTAEQIAGLDRATHYYVIVTPKANLTPIHNTLKAFNCLLPGHIMSGVDIFPELTPVEMKAVVDLNTASPQTANVVKRYPGGYAVFNGTKRVDLTPEVMADDSILYIEAPATTRGNMIPTSFATSVRDLSHPKMNIAIGNLLRDATTRTFSDRFERYCKAATIDMPTIYIVSPRVAELVKDTWTKADSWVAEILVKAYADASILDTSAFTDALCPLAERLASDMNWCRGAQTIPVWRELAKTPRGQEILYSVMRTLGKVTVPTAKAEEFARRITATAVLNWLSPDLKTATTAHTNHIDAIAAQLEETSFLLNDPPALAYAPIERAVVTKVWQEMATLLGHIQPALAFPVAWPMGADWLKVKAKHADSVSAATKLALAEIAKTEQEQQARRSKAA